MMIFIHSCICGVFSKLHMYYFILKYEHILIFSFKKWMTSSKSFLYILVKYPSF